jgi:hypothetical protein
VLEEAGEKFEREVRITPVDRLDFHLEGGIGIEVKIKGGISDLTRQVHRYLQHEHVSALLVVTTKLQHAQLPREMSGKPVVVATLIGSML